MHLAIVTTVHQLSAQASLGLHVLNVVS
jgi:hypothetical protein